MATYELHINNSLVLSADPEAPDAGTGVSLVSLERDYDDPARLTIRAHGDWRSPPYEADSIAVLKRDGVSVFRGLLDLPRPVASESTYPLVEYAAHDDSRLLRFPVAMDSAGNPSIELAPGDLSTLVNQYLAQVAQVLADKGTEQAVTYEGGAGSIQALPVTLNELSVDAGFRRIAAAAPGVRVVAIPNSNGSRCQYTFVNLFGSPVIDVSIDVERIPELSIQQSIEGRAGAVITLSGRTIATADVELDQNKPLVPNWDPADEAAWTMHDAQTVDSDLGPSAKAKVYREFSFEAFADQVDEDTPMVALIKTIEDDVNPRWAKIAVASIDLTNKTLLLERPAIKNLHQRKAGRLEVYSPGRAKQATARLFFKQSGSASTPIFISSVRVPTSGFSGRAVQMAPRTMAYEKVVTVPDGVDAAKYAADVHRALSEPTVAGVIPLNQDLPLDFWFLNRRINLVSDSHGLTGYEGLLAPVMGISVNFEGGISSSIQFNRDDSQLLAEGAQ